ncbi:MAG TPA: hypothetical protein VK541_16370 [Pedobacter sp.]|uniref:hypothetical protein n=1 Tax=Pedobacter sp. TaxID=1411316 RepID=UPI002C6EBE43|nr:hypothetical protein [Pedobacter sp.]HMI04063.1 hypothetical protein [Pedobacter sp.]
MKKLLLLCAICCVIGVANAQTSEETITQGIQTRKVVEIFLDQLGNKEADKIASCFAENIDWYIFESPKFP